MSEHPDDHILDHAVGWVLGLLVIVALISATFFAPENGTIPTQPEKKPAAVCPPVAELQRFSRASHFYPVLRWGLRRTWESCGPTHGDEETGTDSSTERRVL